MLYILLKGNAKYPYVNIRISTNTMYERKNQGSSGTSVGNVSLQRFHCICLMIVFNLLQKFQYHCHCKLTYLLQSTHTDKWTPLFHYAFSFKVWLDKNVCRKIFAYSTTGLLLNIKNNPEGMLNKVQEELGISARSNYYLFMHKC